MKASVLTSDPHEQCPGVVGQKQQVHAGHVGLAVEHPAVAAAAEEVCEAAGTAVEAGENLPTASFPQHHALRAPSAVVFSQVQLQDLGMVMVMMMIMMVMMMMMPITTMMMTMVMLITMMMTMVMVITTTTMRVMMIWRCEHAMLVWKFSCITFHSLIHAYIYIKIMPVILYLYSSVA